MPPGGFSPPIRARDPGTWDPMPTRSCFAPRAIYGWTWGHSRRQPFPPVGPASRLLTRLPSSCTQASYSRRIATRSGQKLAAASLARPMRPCSLGLAWAHEEREDYGSAIEALRELTREEPTNEEAHAGLMRLYALSGRKADALRQYASFERTISRDLGTGPSASTRALKEEIASGRYPPEAARPTGPAAKVASRTPPTQPSGPQDELRGPGARTGRDQASARHDAPFDLDRDGRLGQDPPRPEGWPRISRVRIPTGFDSWS